MRNAVRPSSAPATRVIKVKRKGCVFERMRTGKRRCRGFVASGDKDMSDSEMRSGDRGLLVNMTAGEVGKGCALPMEPSY